MLLSEYVKDTKLFLQSPAQIQNASVIGHDSPQSNINLSFRKPANGDLYSQKVPKCGSLSVLESDNISASSSPVRRKNGEEALQRESSHPLTSYIWSKVHINHYIS